MHLHWVSYKENHCDISHFASDLCKIKLSRHFLVFSKKLSSFSPIPYESSFPFTDKGEILIEILRNIDKIIGAQCLFSCEYCGDRALFDHPSVHTLTCLSCVLLLSQLFVYNCILSLQKRSDYRSIQQTTDVCRLLYITIKFNQFSNDESSISR